MKTLYIFIDESGNFDFSPNGTKHFVLTALSTTEPMIISSSLLELRYSLLPEYKCGPKMEESGYFHCAEDTQAVRDKVFDILFRSDKKIRVDSVIAQKNKTCFDRRDPAKLYELMGTTLLKYSFTRATWQGFDHVVLVFSSIFDKKKRGLLKQAFKSLIKQYAKTSFSLYFHDSKFDLCNQAVDYFCWAIYRKWESGDERSLCLVSKIINSQFPIFERGKIEYYQYKN